MSFLYPIALLGFIGVPILILIYILKNKYTEQTIASTYIWRLSERFLKHKHPISKLRGIISLLLQILAVCAITLIAAHPIITLKQKANDMLFVLDASASMSFMEDDKTRLELAKDKIKEIVDNGVDGDSYSLVVVGDSTYTVYEYLTNKEQAFTLLDQVSPSYLSTDCIDSIEVAQEYYTNNPSLVTYLVTDKNYDCENVNLVNVASSNENYALSDVKYTFDNEKIIVTGKAISYVSNATLDINLSVDEENVENVSIDVEPLIAKDFSFEYATDSYKNIKVEITNTDNLLEDNQTYFYNIKQEHDYQTLIISDKPYLINMAIASMNVTSVDVVAPNDYRDNMRGYGLYVFDSCNPETLPDDGSIWLFNATSSIPKSGISYQDSIETEKGIELKYANSTSSNYKQFSKGLVGSTITVKKYVKYGTYRTFTNILTAEGSPVVFAGSNEYGNREIVFAFDLHDSNFSLLPDYLLLVKNFIEYSFPELLTEQIYQTGDHAYINVLPSFDSIHVISPTGKSSYLNVNTTTADLLLNEVGTYNIIVNANDQEKTFNVYVNYPSKESYPSIDNVYKLHGEAKESDKNGIYEKLIYLFIILAFLCMADWMVYCYEQYQLQ